MITKATISSALLTDDWGGPDDLGNLGESSPGPLGSPTLQMELKSALAILL